MQLDVDNNAGLIDLFLEQFRVDRAQVDILQGHPTVGKDPVQLDNPLHQIRVGLLPERIFPLPEQLIQERGNGIGQGVGIEPVRGQGVPLPVSVHAQLHVIVFPAGLFENLPDVVAEIPLDLEDQGGGPPLRIPRLPAEQLPGKRVHASRGLPGADRPEDGDSGIEAPLRDDEPLRVRNLPGLNRVMRLPDDDGRFLIRVGDRPRGQLALTPFLPWTGLAPDPPDTQKERAADKRNDAGHGGIPTVDHPQKHGRIEGHQRDDGILRSSRKRFPHIPARRGGHRQDK